MNSSHRKLRECAAVEDAAAEWLGRRDGGLSVAQEAELAQWLRTDPLHAATFARLDAASRALDRLRTLRPIGKTEPDPDLALRHFRGWSVLLPLTISAAAALAVAYVAWWRPAREAVTFSRTAVTEVGGLQKIGLPDGSCIGLNTDSAIDIRFTAAERRVHLIRGEADFTVAKNPKRPFVVEAKGVAVRDTGTAFDVRVHPDSVEVLVTEGCVRLSDLQRGTSLVAPVAQGPTAEIRSPEVTARECAIISLVPHAALLPPRPVTEGQILQMLAWQNRKLEFDPTPLGALVAEFNRYNRRKLVVADPAIAGLKIGGTFRVDDYDTFVRLLESSFGITAERSSNEIVLRGPR
jgi:transmembrane sensor